MKNIYNLKIAKICLLVFTLLQIFYPVSAQFWEPFPGNAVHLYSFDNPIHPGVKSYFAAHSDSIIAEGPDSAYYLYRIDRYALSTESRIDCHGQSLPIGLFVLTNQDHCLGRKMLKSPAGICQFVSSNADTFSLQTLAPSGASWTWSGNVTATVDSIVAGQVLGAADSLKYIRLSTGKTLVLSKTHGLVQFFPLIPFGVDHGNTFTGDFKVCGIPDWGLGNHMPHYGEIFQFNAGDRFGQQSGEFQSGGSYKNLRDITINAQVPGTRFSYNATADRMYIQNPPFATPDSTYYTATAFPMSYDSMDYLRLNALPYQHQPVNYPISIPYFQFGMHDLSSTSSRIQIDFRLLSDFDTCAQAHYEFESNTEQSFVTGAGEFLWSLVDNNWGIYRRLYCFEIGTETYGSCLNLSTLIGIDPAEELTFDLYPNPATDKLQLRWDQLPTHPQAITLLAANGQEIVRQFVSPHQNDAEIDLRQLPAGLYLVRVDADGGLQGRRKLVVTH